MSQQALGSRGSGSGLGRAVAGVVFADFIGVLLFTLPLIGGLLGLATMVAGGAAVAWLALEGHPRRRELTWRIGLGNAVCLVVVAIGLFVLALALLSSVQFG